MNPEIVAGICARIDALILEFIADAEDAAPARYEALMTAASLLTQTVDSLTAASRVTPVRRPTSSNAEVY